MSHKAGERRMKNMRPMRIKIQMVLIAGTVFLLSFLIGTCASAQSPGACANEIAQFCPGVSAGGGALKQCLEKHDNELSGWCKSSIKGARAEAEEACHDEIILFCGDTQAGGGRVSQCLKDKESWLSFECKVKMGLLPANR
jgi:hypothetical protein